MILGLKDGSYKSTFLCSPRMRERLFYLKGPERPEFLAGLHFVCSTYLADKYGYAFDELGKMYRIDLKEFQAPRPDPDPVEDGDWGWV